MPPLTAPEPTSSSSSSQVPTRDDVPSSRQQRPRQGRKTALSDKISHLVSRFEPLSPPPATVAKPLLSTTSPFADEADELETTASGGQAERGIGTGAVDRGVEDDVEGAGSFSHSTLVLDNSDDIKEEPQAAPDSPTAATSASTASRNSHRLETTTGRSDSLPAYRDTSHEDLKRSLRGLADEEEKGDLGYSDPFADVFAVIDGNSLSADPLLADSDLFPRTRDSPPLQTPAPPPPTRHSVPLYRVFARKAEPLVLPGLDEAIDALGGAAHFTPMPPLGNGCETLNVDKRESESGKTERSDAFELTAATGDKLTRRGAEWQSWERWVRDGPPPSRWSRFVNALLPMSWRRRSRSPDPSLDNGAREAHLTVAQYKRSLILPPFHLLPPKVTVTDLKANRRRPAPLVTVQTVLKIVGNGILGAAGSSKGISLTTLEGLRDLMQIVTLLVSSSGSPLLPSARDTEPPPGVLRTVFVTVPAFLSLDLVSAFGKALIFLLVLTLLTFAALYEFMRFTGGWSETPVLGGQP